MLFQRVLTALVLIPVVLWVVLTNVPFVFSAFTALVVLLGAWEWSALAGLNKTWHRLAYFVYVFAIFGGTLLLPLGVNLSAALVAWLWLFLSVIMFACAKLPLGVDHKVVRFILGAPLLVVAWLSLNVLRQEPEGVTWILYLLGLVWATDTAAYYAGKYLGKHSLAKLVSPKKTWEGAIAGVIAGLALTAVVAQWLPIYWEMWRIYPVALSIIIFAIFGDLAESLLKRVSGVKDSGSLLPGHGGVLDRIDSLIAAAPLLVFLQLWLFS